MTPTEAHKKLPVSVFVVTAQPDQRKAPELVGVFRTEEAARAACAGYFRDDFTQEYVALGKSVGVVRIVVEETHLLGAWGHDDGNNMRYLERSGFVHGLTRALSLLDAVADEKPGPSRDQFVARLRYDLLNEVRSVTAGE